MVLVPCDSWITFNGFFLPWSIFLDMCVLIRALLTAGVSAYFQGNFAKLSPPLAVACDFQLLKGAWTISSIFSTYGVCWYSCDFLLLVFWPEKSLMTVTRQALSSPHLLLISQESLFFVAWQMYLKNNTLNTSGFLKGVVSNRNIHLILVTSFRMETNITIFNNLYEYIEV